MAEHLAVPLGEIIALAGMLVFFLCFLPRPAFAGVGIRPAAPAVAGHFAPGSTLAKARIADRLNSRNPLYKLMDLLVRTTGRRRWSYPLAVFLISLLVRAALLPLAIRQYRDGKRMQMLAPELRRLQEECAKEPGRLSQAIGTLYREHGIDPRMAAVAGIAQAVIFLCLYRMVWLYQYQFAHGAFLWIGSALSHAHPGWVAANLAQPDLPLLLLYAISMCFTPWLLSNSGGTPANGIKATAVFSAVVMTGVIWFGHTASAFVLYWLISNILMMVTQALIARRAKADAA